MAPLNVNALSREKRVEEAILRGARLLPADAYAQLKAFLSPESLAILVGSLVGLAVAQAFGIGELADALILIAAIGYCGRGAVEGCRDLYHFVKTALDARSESDLDLAGQYFASAVIKIGVTALMAFLLKKPLKSFRQAGGLRSFRTMNYKPGLRSVSPPPAPGTVEPFVARPLIGKRGSTDPYGNITVEIRLPYKEQNLTMDHEAVHRFFSPKFGPFLHLRARVAVSGYFRSAMLRYLEEAMAEGYAQVRAEGFRGVITGIKFPLEGEHPYITIQQAAAFRGQFLGVIIVDGQAMIVSLEHGSAYATPQKSEQSPASSQGR